MSYGVSGAIGPYGNNVEAMVQNIKAVASNVSQGTNPPYAIGDFLAMYAQFGGVSVQITGSVADNQITGLSSVTGINVGMLIVGNDIPDGTTVTAVDSINMIITMSANATSAATVSVMLYTPVVPIPVLQAYVSMASTCIQQTRWHSLWNMAMGLFIAHFVTLFLQSMVPAGSAVGKILAASQARNITASKSVGDVSTSYDTGAIADDLKGWAAYKTTIYGQQLATLARPLGRGGMLVW